MEEMWLARDKNGKIYLYGNRPKKTMGHGILTIFQV